MENNKTIVDFLKVEQEAYSNNHNFKISYSTVTCLLMADIGLRVLCLLNLHNNASK